VQNHFPCRRRHSNPNLFSPLVSTSTGTPIRAARRGFICRAADYRLQLIFPASSPSVRSSPVRLFWMWNEAMASDGGSSSFRELYGNIHTPAVLTGAAFALVALLLSLWLILQHLRSYSNPAVSARVLVLHSISTSHPKKVVNPSSLSVVW